MTIEDDAITLLQGVIIVATPILLSRTVMLWQGIIEGGVAKSQAADIFLTDPWTIISIIACAGVMIVFWTLALFTRRNNSK